MSDQATKRKELLEQFALVQTGLLLFDLESPISEEEVEAAVDKVLAKLRESIESGKYKCDPGFSFMDSSLNSRCPTLFCPGHFQMEK